MCSESLDIAGFDSIISIRICQYSFTVVTSRTADKTNGELASKQEKRYSHFADIPVRTMPEQENGRTKEKQFPNVRNGTWSVFIRLIDREDRRRTTTENPGTILTGQN
jgi:hypothetical protein